MGIFFKSPKQKVKSLDKKIKKLYKKARRVHSKRLKRSGITKNRLIHRETRLLQRIRHLGIKRKNLLKKI